MPELELEWRQVNLIRQLNDIQPDFLSRTSLVQIIESNIDLYARERRSSPMEDVIQTMRNKDVRVWFESPEAFRISFEYPDAHLAQRVVRALAIALVDSNERLNRNPLKMDGEPLPAEQLDIVDEASLPERSARPNRYAIAGIGLCAGFVLGLAGFAMRRVSWRQALRMTAAALSGFAVAGGVTYLLPDDKFANLLARLPFAGLGAAAGLLVWAVVRGGRAAWRRPHYLWSALAGGALGAIAAGMVAYAIPPRYESQGVLRVHAATKTGTLVEDVNERYAEIRDEVLSRSSLEEFVLRPSLDLYPGERKLHSMEEVIANMRATDLRIAPMTPTPNSQGPVSAALISFNYPDRFKAQAVVHEVVTKFAEGNGEIEGRPNRGKTHAGTGVMGPASLAEAPLFLIDRGRNQGETHAGTIVMEVLDPASLPVEPLSPQSPATMAVAAGAGALLALALAFLRRRPPGQAAAMLKLGAVGTAAGALLAGAIAFAIPSRYVSTAVLQIRPGIGGKVSTRHVVDYAVQETPMILSRSNLAELMQRSNLDLYHGERARHPMEQVIDKMREDLRIEPPAPALRTTFSIAFTYTDRFKAQAVIRELVSTFVESYVTSQRNDATYARSLGLDWTEDGAWLQELDPASLPEAPVWPPRRGIITGGMLAGLLLGLVAVVIRRGPGSPGVDAAVSDPACASPIFPRPAASDLSARSTCRAPASPRTAPAE
jgi:uncharacterized protein involved in exopolysaccharide biosynthesis